jgi:hypothetical protein
MKSGVPQAHTLLKPRVQQREGTVAAPTNWRYQDIEYRGSMVLPLLMIPAIRYTQDTPEDRDALLARDVAALGSATAIYLFLQKVLSNGIHKLSTSEVQEKLPDLLKGAARAIGADLQHQKFKNQFFSYIPAQAISLVTSALVGPAIGTEAMKHLKNVKGWLTCPDKRQHLKEAWTSQPRQEKNAYTQEMLIGAASFAAILPLSYRMIRHAANEGYPNKLLRVVDHDIPAILTSVLGAVGIAKILTPNPERKKQPPYPASLKGRVKDFFVRDKDPNVKVAKLKAPTIGAALLGTTYSAALLGGLGYVAINRHNPEKLDKFLNYETAYHAMHWVLPSLLLPTIRYTQDPKDRRDEFYIRDFTHFWLGTLVFWAAKQGAKPLIKGSKTIAEPALAAIKKNREALLKVATTQLKLPQDKINDSQLAKMVRDDAVKLGAATAATLLQIASNGFLAPKFSHQFVTYLNKPDESKPNPRKIDP